MHSQLEPLDDFVWRCGTRDLKAPLQPTFTSPAGAIVEVSKSGRDLFRALAFSKGTIDWPCVDSTATLGLTRLGPGNS